MGSLSVALLLVAVVTEPAPKWLVETTAPRARHRLDTRLRQPRRLGPGKRACVSLGMLLGVQASLGCGVAGVVEVGSGEEVRLVVAAGRVVAVVQDVEAVWDLALANSPRETMGSPSLAGDLDRAVPSTSLIDRSSENPAGCPELRMRRPALVHARPEMLYGGRLASLRFALETSRSPVVAGPAAAQANAFSSNRHSPSIASRGL